MKPRRVVAFGHAKVNIGWRVGALRDDGYHDVTGLIQTISLADRLEFVADDGDGVRVSVPSDPSLEGDSNLVYRAAELLGDRAPVHVTIDKQIPVAAGLGGGSADAAAALVALNVLWGCELSARKLVELGAEIGSDVPAMLAGGLVHVSGRGERVRRIGSTSGYGFVLGISDAAISTPDAYRAFDAGVRSESDRIEHNDLEAAACSLVDGLAAKVEAMREACGVAFVSGSGPTVVGMGSSDAAERVRGVFDRVETATPTDSGVVLRLK
jgi:4-diphosphocytidyl-2-C-methyl-D-erythritol kinase